MVNARSMWIKSIPATALLALAVAIGVAFGFAAGAQAAWANVQVGQTDGLLSSSSETVLSKPTESLTAWTNDYDKQARCVNSYLSLVELWEDEDGDGQESEVYRLQRVEYIEGVGLVVEFYDKDTFKFISGKVIDPETYRPSGMSAGKQIIWGGYYHGSDANYVIVGQQNDSEDAELPVIRVTKYNRDWVPTAIDYGRQPVGDNIRALELKDINTRVPFAAGSCRIIEQDGNLWIYTCHEMYGAHNQASMIFVVEADNLGLTDLFVNNAPPDPSEYVRFNYVSRTFNQFITNIGEHVYTADHCDAFPARAFVLGNLDGWHTYTSLPRFAGDDGDAATHAGLGGLEASAAKDMLIVAGKSIDQASAGSTPHNVWVSLVDAASINGDGSGSGQTSSPEYTWLTNYTSETASVPALAKVDDDKFIVAWGKKPSDSSAAYGAQVNYQFFNTAGEMLGSTHTMSGMIGDCQPIVYDGKVVWYATGKSADSSAAQTTYSKSAPAFYAVDATTMEPVVINPLKSAKISLEAQTYTYTGAQIKPQVTSVKDNGKMLVEGTDYTVSYGANVNAGTGTVTIRGLGDYEGGEKSASFTISPANFFEAKVAYDYWQKYTGKAVTPKVSVTFHGKALVQGTDFTVSYKDNVKIGKGVILLFGKGNYQARQYIGYSFYITDGLDLAAPKQVKVAPVGAKGIKVTWEKVTGATKYAVYRNGTLASTVSTTSWTDTSAKVNGGKYTYQVYAVSDLDASAASKPAATYFLARSKVKSAKSTAARQATIKWTKNVLAGGYQVRYKLGTTSKTVSVKKPTTVKKVLSRLKAGKTYKVQVRVVRKVGKKTYYSAWSALKKVKVRKG